MWRVVCASCTKMASSTGTQMLLPALPCGLFIVTSPHMHQAASHDVPIFVL